MSVNKIPTQEELEQLREFQQEMEEDSKEDITDDQQDSQFEFQEGYGPPDPEEKHNPHTFLNKAAFISPDTLRVTNLGEEELGKPIFNVRFLLDMEDIAEFYLGGLCEEMGTEDQKTGNKIPLPNRISQYFREKVINITDSGMSKEGFTMLMNTTKNINVSRTRKKQRLENLKGGIKR